MSHTPVGHNKMNWYPIPLPFGKQLNKSLSPQIKKHETSVILLNCRKTLVFGQFDASFELLINITFF